MEIISEESEESRNNFCRLNHEWIQVLINLRMKYAKSFTGKRHSATVAWDSILKEMHELGAPKSVTRLKLKKKWMNLIARYKQLKAEGDSTKQNSWPYFDQINRAHSRSTDNNPDKKLKSIVADKETEKITEKEKFIRSLIDLRYKYQNLFTGKKYAAQKGWMIIQNHLPSSTPYSTDQIKKIWHNLMHRYKALLVNEPDQTKITWIYFDQLHKHMTKGKMDKQWKPQGDDAFADQEFLDEEKPKERNECSTGVSTAFLIDETYEESDVSMNEENQEISINDLLTYLKKRDQNRDEQMMKLLRATKEILLLLKNNV